MSSSQNCRTSLGESHKKSIQSHRTMFVLKSFNLMSNFHSSLQMIILESFSKLFPTIPPVIISMHLTLMDRKLIRHTSLLKVCSLLRLIILQLINILLAPTEVTLHDFIRMIWQLRIQSIIMLTRLFEDGKVNKQ